MRRFVLLIGLGAGMVVFAHGVGGCTDRFASSCEPSGTFVESSGLHVRSHGADACEL